MLIADLYRQLVQQMRHGALRWRGVDLGRDCAIGPGIGVRLGVASGKKGRISAGTTNQWERGVILDAYGGAIVLGGNVFLGPYTVIYGHGGVEIGDHSLVSMHCRILSSDHSVPAPGVTIRSQPDLRQPTRIGRDVWLGAGVTVLGGVTIGDGCVVGAGAVVSKDLPPNSVAVGVPAVVVRQRR